MGGYGSGRHAGRPTIEAARSLTLDVNRVARLVRKHVPSLSGNQKVAVEWKASWPQLEARSPSGTLVVFLTLGRDRGHAEFVFNVDHVTHRTGPRNQRVELESTPCHFGGVRWWWVCPMSGRRCAKLYLPNGGNLFAGRGRGAYQMAYASQNAGAMANSHCRIARLHRRLGHEYTSLPDYPPDRPKWMRHRTYDRLVAEWETAIDRHDDIYVAKHARLIEQMGWA